MVEGANPNPRGPRIRWYKVSSVPGPHLVQYIWWFAANTVLRWWHARSGRLSADPLLSPGINAWDADIVHVHIVFEGFYQRMKNQLRFRSTPPSSWRLLVHRRLYYGLARWLESQFYPKDQVQFQVWSRISWQPTSVGPMQNTFGME